MSNVWTPADDALASELLEYYADPLGFVYFAYPWGQPGMLQDYDGPDVWQQEFLTDLGNEVRERGFDGVNAVPPIRMTISSGHGIGKGTLGAWLGDWILSTRPYSQGTITANSFPQLATKTWATLTRWTRMCVTGHWFNIGVDKISAKLAPDTWFVTAQTCREENSESFAGQHAANSTSWYLMDEASAIPDVIWGVAEGGLVRGEPMIFAFGNPTRNTGKFHRICFGSERGRWKQRIIDSRDCKMTNKTLYRQWAEDHGEDSDFFRVRVKGLPPAASDAQYISSDLVYGAQRREVVVLPDEPLVVGLDIARGGADNCVFRFRHGLDARSITPIKIPGEEARDSMRLVSVAADVLSRQFACKDGKDRRVNTMFIDETGVGGPIVDRLKQMGYADRIIGIQFGGRSPDPKFDNMRSFMWGRTREWLAKGAIDADAQLEMDLCGPGYGHTKRDKLILESKESMKKRDLNSPDDGDALGLTFAAPVVSQLNLMPPNPIVPVMVGGFGSNNSGLGWMG